MTANARATFPAPATGTPPRSCGRVFTCGEAQIVTSPFVYRCMGIFMPEKLGNLQVNFAKDTIDLKLRDFAVSIGCAESLELTDDKINIIEQHLHSDEVSWQSLGELLERVIGTGATLSTTQINVSFCDRNIALAQIYSELKRMDSYEIRRSQLLTAFLENAEIDNTVDSVLPEELIKVVPMDDSQREAVCRALNSRVSVVVGPPGCSDGKGRPR